MTDTEQQKPTIEDRLAALEAWRDSMPRSGRMICPGCNGRLLTTTELTCMTCHGKGFVNV